MNDDGTDMDQKEEQVAEEERGGNGEEDEQDHHWENVRDWLDEMYPDNHQA